MDTELNTDQIAARQNKQTEGIKSDQKSERWFLIIIGGIFVVSGVATMLILLPDAISKQDYTVLISLLFVFAGTGFLYHAFKINQAYWQFGPTPLFLDPLTPGVGGQFGGRFNINNRKTIRNSNPAIPPKATLACTRISRARRKGQTSIEILWQEQGPVYLEQTANGLAASFVFDIPKTCTPTQELSRRSSIEWKLTVEADFDVARLDKFERNWEVVIDDIAAQASQELHIPQGFLHKAEKINQDYAKKFVLEQVSVTEELHCAKLHSKAARAVDGGIIGMLFGLISIGAGCFMVSQDSPVFGYLFILLGGAFFFNSLYRLGKVIEVTIDKRLHVLNTQTSWFGFVFARQHVDMLDSDKLCTMQVSSSSTRNKKTKYFAVDYKSGDRSIRISDEIEGEAGAHALIAAIEERIW